MVENREIRVFHVCGAIGGGAKGFQRASVRVGNLQGVFRCLGSVDVDPAACRDFEKLIGSKATVMDLFSRDQYTAWHGHEPPAGWREATPEDIRRAAGNERPHIVFTSSPCKGFSGLLNEGRAKTAKYQALNELALRSVWLSMEAWKDDPPEFFLLENVPRIATRGRRLLDQLRGLLEHYGYAVAETTHDCGELGGMAQSRKRFLLVARHQAKVPPFLYEPPARPLRGIGTLLDRCPLPGDVERAGPMHRVPALQWKTWVRLAFVEAGNDWRSLQKLRVADGVLQDFCIVPEHAMPGAQTHPVNDPRFNQSARWNDGQQYGVQRWEDTSGTITGQPNPGQGRFSVADPRCSGGFEGKGKYKVTRYDQPTGTVISGSTTGQGAFAVADPRPSIDRSAGNYLTAGHYGVVPYDATSKAVTGSACHDNGFWSVADPRVPEPSEKLTCVIRSLDGTWHRALTTFELSVLQSLIDPEEQLELDGLSDQAWRERIGNAVPPDAAEAVAIVMGRTLLAAWSGQTFFLDSMPIWVRQVGVAIALPGNVAEAA
ncbi:DNA cytosine methyltransferase [Dyella ginsengisoli]|uniref:DNA cytosine methyltransferase n=1 Tax=Dyella ginsengisoli TaxID=363848 RepID=UPI000347A2E0|nr:DNA cytosine methyltransferase [Dyella ginsengisoli]